MFHATMSNENKQVVLGYIEDERLQGQMGIIINHYKDPLLNKQYKK